MRYLVKCLRDVPGPGVQTQPRRPEICKWLEANAGQYHHDWYWATYTSVSISDPTVAAMFKLRYGVTF